MEIKVVPLAKEELKPKYESEENLGFGQIFTDRMLVSHYHEGWSDPIIQKYEPLVLDPAAICLQYGQSIFEGQKAYLSRSGSINLFRPNKNVERFKASAARMVMPSIDDNIYFEGLKELLRLEKDWIPSSIGSSLYIRPTMLGIDGRLGVQPSKKFLFYIILSPSGSFFPEGFKPVKIYVSDFWIRAAPGGTGFAKTGGNYGASLLVGEEATKKGCDQVLWLDAIHKKYVEEVGAMNIFFIIDDVIYTAPLQSGTILAGVTRESLIYMAKDLGYKVNEEALSIERIINCIKNKTLTECFGSGTAASIAPVGALTYKTEEYVIDNFEIGPISQTLYDKLIGIQYGLISDPYNWIVTIN